MKINIFVKTNQPEQRIEKIDENNYKILIKNKPIQGRANQELIKIIELGE